MVLFVCVPVVTKFGQECKKKIELRDNKDHVSTMGYPRSAACLHAEEHVDRDEV